MQAPVTVSLAQCDAVLGDVERNLEAHLGLAAKAREQGAGLIVFPELSLTGYGLRGPEKDRAAYDVGAFWARTGAEHIMFPTDAVRLDVGPHALGCHAFVCRAPDENHAEVYRWLLQRNLRMYAVSFAVDRLGDIYLDARLPLSSATPDELDRLLGSVLTYADESFNTILELGFASSIRKEWEWRKLRGEPTHNLEAFRGWLER